MNSYCSSQSTKDQRHGPSGAHLPTPSPGIWEWTLWGGTRRKEGAERSRKYSEPGAPPKLPVWPSQLFHEVDQISFIKQKAKTESEKNKNKKLS